MTSPTAGAASGQVRADRVDAVVIGASYGGVEALSILLPAVPASLRPAVLIVLHLPRERASVLAEIFSAKCARPVREAVDKEPVEPGTVYFAPPDYHLLVDSVSRPGASAGAGAGDGNGPNRGRGGRGEAPVAAQLALSTDDLVNFSRPSIDVLFESAADVYGPRLLGIVLTGANHDGAAGLAAVHAASGITVVQHPDTAQAALMPMAAIKRSPVDYVLTLDQIADLLRTLEGETAAGSASMNTGVSQ
jgi:two-component system, chemotaxis family, protein-glutamate methylesterase/glutaminase